MLGISLTGIREIAASKNDKNRMNTVFSSLLLLNGILTLLAVVILIALIYLVPQLYVYKNLLFIGVLKLIANFCLFEWLYKGLEDFKYITQRTIFVKLLYVVCVFAFIRSSDDYPLYYFFIVMMVVLNAILNCAYSRHFVKFVMKGISFKPYLASYFTIGGYMILSSMYTSFNVRA